MSKVLEVQLTDEVFAKLEQIAHVSALSATEVAENMLKSALADKTVPTSATLSVDFDAALTYALSKNEELLRRLAK